MNLIIPPLLSILISKLGFSIILFTFNNLKKNSDINILKKFNIKESKNIEDINKNLNFKNITYIKNFFYLKKLNYLIELKKKFGTKNILDFLKKNIQLFNPPALLIINLKYLNYKELIKILLNNYKNYFLGKILLFKNYKNFFFFNLKSKLNIIKYNNFLYEIIKKNINLRKKNLENEKNIFKNDIIKYTKLIIKNKLKIPLFLKKKINCIIKISLMNIKWKYLKKKLKY